MWRASCCRVLSCQLSRQKTSITEESLRYEERLNAGSIQLGGGTLDRPRHLTTRTTAEDATDPAINNKPERDDEPCPDGIFRFIGTEPNGGPIENASQYERDQEYPEPP